MSEKKEDETKPCKLLLIGTVGKTIQIWTLGICAAQSSLN